MNISVERVKKVSDEYAELLHYTTFAGLEGILRNRSLWCTHIRFLNDDQEVDFFFDRVLPRYVRAAFTDYFAELRSGASGAARFTEDELPQAVEAMINSLRIVHKEAHDQYVLCFSAPAGHGVADHGLLSQWRGYGSDGGYALVFDTEKLEEQLGAEAHNFPDTLFWWSNVEYALDHEEIPVGREKLKCFNTLRTAVLEFLRTGEFAKASDVWVDLPFLATTCKHWGFAEEREVRIVVNQIGSEVRRRYPDAKELRRHQVHYFQRNSSPVPTIHLFETDKGLNLPIKRVLVGPHANKYARKKAVEMLLEEVGLDAEVMVSEIPFRG